MVAAMHDKRVTDVAEAEQGKLVAPAGKITLLSHCVSEPGMTALTALTAQNSSTGT